MESILFSRTDGALKRVRTFTLLFCLLCCPAYRIILLLRGRIVDASERIQASRIADIGKALRNNLNKKCFVITHLHIAGRVGCKLRFAASLSRDKAKSNHLTLSVIQTCAGIVIPEAVADSQRLI